MNSGGESAPSGRVAESGPHLDYYFPQLAERSGKSTRFDLRSPNPAPSNFPPIRPLPAIGYPPSHVQRVVHDGGLPMSERQRSTGQLGDELGVQSWRIARLFEQG